MSNDEIKKKIPKKEYQSVLTFQTRDLNYQNRNIIHEKTKKLNPQQIKNLSIKSRKIIIYKNNLKQKMVIKRMRVKIKIKNK